MSIPFTLTESTDGEKKWKKLNFLSLFFNISRNDCSIHSLHKCRHMPSGSLCTSHLFFFFFSSSPSLLVLDKFFFTHPSKIVKILFASNRCRGCSSLRYQGNWLASLQASTNIKGVQFSSIKNKINARKDYFSALSFIRCRFYHIHRRGFFNRPCCSFIHRS